MKTHKGKLVHETPLEVFEGRPLTEFMTKTGMGTVNNQPRYSLSIFGPFSGELIVECNNLGPNAVKVFENIGTVLRCKYCNTKNFAVTSRCTHCGGVL